MTYVYHVLDAGNFSSNQGGGGGGGGVFQTSRPYVRDKGVVKPRPY